MSNKRQRLSSPTSRNEPELEIVYVEAHEVDLIYDNDSLANKVESKGTEVEGGRLLNWKNGIEGEIWIDRYDILNLLDSIPETTSIDSREDLEDVGFEEMPDEEMWYFDSIEREDLSRKKKKRLMEEGRAERIRVREEEDRLEAEAKRSENEPSEDQLALMKKLHQTLSGSPDPSLLEIRILASHGVDPRFSFLRKGGRFREVWDKIREGDTEEAVAEVEVEKESGSLLVAYASDSDDEEKKEEVVAEEEIPIVEEESEEARLKKEMKAEKAREWARKRKEAREATVVIAV